MSENPNRRRMNNRLTPQDSYAPKPRKLRPKPTELTPMPYSQPLLDNDGNTLFSLSDCREYCDNGICAQHLCTEIEDFQTWSDWWTAEQMGCTQQMMIENPNNSCGYPNPGDFGYHPNQLPCLITACEYTTHEGYPLYNMNCNAYDVYGPNACCMDNGHCTSYYSSGIIYDNYEHHPGGWFDAGVWHPFCGYNTSHDGVVASNYNPDATPIYICADLSDSDGAGGVTGWEITDWSERGRCIQWVNNHLNSCSWDEVDDWVDPSLECIEHGTEIMCNAVSHCNWCSENNSCMGINQLVTDCDWLYCDQAIRMTYSRWAHFITYCRTVDIQPCLDFIELATKCVMPPVCDTPNFDNPDDCVMNNEYDLELGGGNIYQYAWDEILKTVAENTYGMWTNICQWGHHIVDPLLPCDEIDPDDIYCCNPDSGDEYVWDFWTWVTTGDGWVLYATYFYGCPDYWECPWSVLYGLPLQYWDYDEIGLDGPWMGGDGYDDSFRFSYMELNNVFELARINPAALFGEYSTIYGAALLSVMPFNRDLGLVIENLHLASKPEISANLDIDAGVFNLRLEIYDFMAVVDWCTLGFAGLCTPEIAGTFCTDGGLPGTCTDDTKTAFVIDVDIQLQCTETNLPERINIIWNERGFENFRVTFGESGTGFEDLLADTIEPLLNKKTERILNDILIGTGATEYDIESEIGGSYEIVDELYYPLQMLESQSNYVNSVIEYIGRMWCTLDSFNDWALTSSDFPGPCIDCSACSTDSSCWFPSGTCGGWWNEGEQHYESSGCGINEQGTACVCLEPWKGCCP